MPRPLKASRIRHAEGLACDLSLVTATLDWFLDEGYFRGQRRSVYTQASGGDWEYTFSVLTSKGFTALGAVVEVDGENVRIGDVIHDHLNETASAKRSTMTRCAIDRFIGIADQSVPEKREAQA